MKTFLILCTALCTIFCNAQKISLTAGLGIFQEKHSAPYEDPENVGGSVIVELHTAYGPNLISLSYITGAEFVIMSTSEMSFQEINAMYGRAFPLSNNFQVEALAGLGYYHLIDTNYNYNWNTYTSEELNVVRMAFPLRLNLRFLPNRRFSFGLKTNYNINSFGNVFSQQLYGTFTFK